MIDWLQNPHADYVITAYGIALAALAGLAVFSWRFVIVQNRKWRQLQQSRKG